MSVDSAPVLTADDWHGIKFWMERQRAEARRMEAPTAADFERIYEKVCAALTAERHREGWNRS